MTIWDEELTQALVRLIEGGASQMQAARTLGLSRNQVIGKLWRINVKSRIPPNVSRPKKIIKLKPPARPRVPAPPKPQFIKRRLPGRLLYNMGFRGAKQ